MNYISLWWNNKKEHSILFGLLLFSALSILNIFVYQWAGLKAAFKIDILIIILVLGTFFYKNTKAFLLTYILSLLFPFCYILFSPYFKLYKDFVGIFIEVKNVYAPLSSLVRTDGIYSYNLLEIIGTVVFIAGFIGRKYIKYPKVTKFLFIYSMFTFFSIFTSVNPFKAFIQSFHLFLSLIMFLLFLHEFGNNEKFDKILVVLALIVVLVHVAPAISKKAIFNLLKGRFLYREAGKFANPNSPALLSGMGAVFSAYLFLKEKSLQKLLYSVFFILFVLVIFCTGSRNGLISSSISVFLLSILYLRIREKGKKHLLSSAFLLLILFTLLIFLGKLVLHYRLNLQFIRFDTSIWARITLWRNSFKYFVNNSLLPLGPGNFFYMPGSLSLVFAHNLFINTLVESGVIPFLMLLYVAIYAIGLILRLLKIGLKGSINFDHALAVSYFVYIVLMFSVDQFLYDGTLWRFSLIFLAFAISKLKH